MPCLFAVCFANNHLSAQEKGRDTIALLTVDVMPVRTDLPDNGQRVEKIDSARLALYRTQNLAALLSEQSSVHIKTYGPGGIASTAFRGGNAAQTAFVWNGINIQNYLLGQTDLSLLPAFLFDEVQLEYGSSSALWGGGAVGGSVLLNNKSAFGQGVNASVGFGAGSFGLMNFSARLGISQRRFVSTTKLYDQSSANNYVYDKDARRARHGAYEFRGVLQEFRWLFRRDQFSVAAWITDNSRQIPVFNETIGGSVQSDKNRRITAGWTHFGKKVRSQYNAALLDERINFDDSISSVFSSSRVSTMIIEEDHAFHAGRHLLHAGLNLSGSKALSDNYVSSKTFVRAALLLSDRYAMFRNRLVLQACARMEYFSVTRLPFTFNTSADFQLSKNMIMKVNVARVFRQPVFNELYWQPGGNPDLKPEQGYSAEGSLIWKKQFAKTEVTLAGSAFNRRIQNWILWVPGPGGSAAAVNVSEVWSRGTDTESAIRWQHKNLNLAFLIRSGYVLSTVFKSSLQDDASLGRQLIYTPRYNGSASLQFGFRSARLVWTTQYAGYRFTSSDNAQWLAPFLVHQARLSLSLLKNLLQLNLQCNNISNAVYSVVAGRPMPLRNYEAGLVFKINNLKFKHRTR